MRLAQVGVSFNSQAMLGDVDPAIEPDQIVTLVGPSGAGRTTLVRSVLGLLKPHIGEVQRRPWLTIGYMPQELHANTALSLNILRFLRLMPEVRCEQALAASHEVGAAHVLERPLQSISGGELQHVLPARALLCRPGLLVLDKPMQGVDAADQAELYRLIGRPRDRYDCGMLTISHDLHLMMSATDQVVCLNRRICCSGHPKQISGDPIFAELFGQDARSLAIYRRHHDHVHDLRGEVVKAGPGALPPSTRFIPVHKYGPGCSHG